MVFATNIQIEVVVQSVHSVPRNPNMYHYIALRANYLFNSKLFVYALFNYSSISPVCAVFRPDVPGGFDLW